jgi:ribosomal protein L23
MKQTNKGVSFQRTKLVKKAIVTLEKGDTIDLYENI